MLNFHDIWSCLLYAHPPIPFTIVKIPKQRKKLLSISKFIIDLVAIFKRDETKHFTCITPTSSPQLEVNNRQKKAADKQQQQHLCAHIRINYVCDVWLRSYRLVYPGAIRPKYTFASHFDVSMLNRYAARPHDDANANWEYSFGTLLINQNNFITRPAKYNDSMQSELRTIYFEHIFLLVIIPRSRWVPPNSLWWRFRKSHGRSLMVRSLIYCLVKRWATSPVVCRWWGGIDVWINDEGPEWRRNNKNKTVGSSL